MVATLGNSNVPVYISVDDPRIQIVAFRVDQPYIYILSELNRRQDRHEVLFFFCTLSLLRTLLKYLEMLQLNTRGQLLLGCRSHIGRTHIYSAVPGRS